MDLVALTEQLRELVELVSPITQPVPKLKGGHKNAYDSGPERPGTVASGPRSIAKSKGAEGGTKAHKDDGGGTQAGVKPKSLGRDTKTQATPKTGTKAKTGGGSKPTSCPGGGQPRMVFGKWRCTGGGSKGAQQAKSRIAAKRKKKAAPKPKVGGLAKLVNKARAALKGLFK